MDETIDFQPTETIDLPPTEATQIALHEATGHLYDALVEATLEQDEPIPDGVFDDLESLYVATAEGSVSNVQISFECS